MVLRTPVTGLTTSGSSHPRVELREMAGNTAVAGWNANDGKTHTLDVSMTVSHLTAVSGRTVVN